MNILKTPLQLNVGRLHLDIPRTVGYYGGITAAVALGILDPPLALFIAAVPVFTLLTAPTAPTGIRLLGRVLQGTAKPVSSDDHHLIAFDDAQPGRKVVDVGAAPQAVPDRDGLDRSNRSQTPDDTAPAAMDVPVAIRPRRARRPRPSPVPVAANRTGASPPAEQGTSPGPAGTAEPGLSRRIRTWARENGVPVNGSGRLPASVITAYTAATQQAPTPARAGRRAASPAGAARSREAAASKRTTPRPRTSGRPAT